MPLMHHVLYSICLYLSIQAERVAPIWDMLLLWWKKSKGKLGKPARVVNSSAQNWHRSLLTFHWLRRSHGQAFFQWARRSPPPIGRYCLMRRGEMFNSLAGRQRIENHVIYTGGFIRISVSIYFVLLISDFMDLEVRDLGLGCGSALRSCVTESRPPPLSGPWCPCLR